jgi:hypothetical protein
MSGVGLGLVSLLGLLSESLLPLSFPFSSRSGLLYKNKRLTKFIICCPRTLVHAFPEAGLGVSVATGGYIYQSDI